MRKLRREQEKTERDVISLREGGREFHKWIVEAKKDFENEEVRQKESIGSYYGDERIGSSMEDRGDIEVQEQGKKCKSGIF